MPLLPLLPGNLGFLPLLLITLAHGFASFVQTSYSTICEGVFILLPALLVFFSSGFHVGSINICYGLIDLLILHDFDIHLLGKGGWWRVSVGLKQKPVSVTLSF